MRYDKVSFFFLKIFFFILCLDLILKCFLFLKNESSTNFVSVMYKNKYIKRFFDCVTYVCMFCSVIVVQYTRPLILDLNRDITFCFLFLYYRYISGFVCFFVLNCSHNNHNVKSWSKIWHMFFMGGSIQRSSFFWKNPPNLTKVFFFTFMTKSNRGSLF